MTNELKPVKCGCGGDAKVQRLNCDERYFVFCRNCHIDSGIYDTEAEAIEAWNRAMNGNCEKCNNHERTAKAVTEDNISICDNCSYVVFTGMKYCPSCGARLEWNE